MNQWERIESLARGQRLTLKKLAEIAGVVPSAINKWKDGSQIRTGTIIKIAEHFKVPVDSLLCTSVNHEQRRPDWSPSCVLRDGEAHFIDTQELDRLRAEVADLRRQLDEAREVIRNQAAALAAVHVVTAQTDAVYTVVRRTRDVQKGGHHATH